MIGMKSEIRHDKFIGSCCDFSHSFFLLVSNMSKKSDAADPDLKMDVKEWVHKGPAWNIEWLDRNPSHILAKTWDVVWKRSMTAVQTSCAVTAEMIREKMQPGKKWTILDPSEVSWDIIRKKYPIFQISLGDEWMSDDHMLTVVGDHVLQSYYRKYTLRVDPLTPEWISAIKNPSPKSWKTLTFGQSNENTYSVFYWVPH
jgi:hypothetical protein